MADGAGGEPNPRDVPPGAPLPEVLPLLVGLGRTGLVSEANGQTWDYGHRPFELWIEAGRVVDAAWGDMRALFALEMAAVFLADSNFHFTERLKPPSRSLDLSPTDLAVRLADVARQGRALTRLIPGPWAVPMRVERRESSLPDDPEAVRLLDRIDGQRSVADLVAARQPLVTLRGLGVLVEHGAVAFEPASLPRPAEVPLPPAAPAAQVAEAPPAPALEAAPVAAAERGAVKPPRLSRAVEEAAATAETAETAERPAPRGEVVPVAGPEAATVVAATGERGGAGGGPRVRAGVLLAVLVVLAVVLGGRVFLSAAQGDGHAAGPGGDDAAAHTDTGATHGHA